LVIYKGVPLLNRMVCAWSY